MTDAVFIGKVGNRKSDILNILKAALWYRRGVPETVNKEYQHQATQGDRRVSVGTSPDSIAFKRDERVFRIEDGRLWAGYEEGRLYTDDDWLRF